MLWGWCLGAVASIHQGRLANGLGWVFESVPGSQVVAVQVWYRVGSADERNGRTGLAHMLEHMMFQGTKMHSHDQLIADIQSHGGEFNAFTSSDFTAYVTTMPKAHWQRVLTLEADRMHHLLWRQDTFERENQVVREERRLRTDDKPEALLRERLLAMHHLRSPYHHGPIGWMSDLEGMTLSDAQTFYQQWYHPNNATVVVVGDLDAWVVKKAVTAAFASLPAQELPKRWVRKDLKKLGLTRFSMPATVKAPRLWWMFQAPRLTPRRDWEPYALMMLSTYLTSGDSSPWVSDLVYHRALASFVEAFYDPYRRFTPTFNVVASPMPGVGIKRLRLALLEAVARVKTHPPSSRDLERVRAQLLAEYHYGRDRLDHRATLLGSMVSLGLGTDEPQIFERMIRGVTAKQIQAVAQTYLRPTLRTEGVLCPRKGVC